MVPRSIAHYARRWPSRTSRLVRSDQVRSRIKPQQPQLKARDRSNRWRQHCSISLAHRSVLRYRPSDRCEFRPQLHCKLAIWTRPNLGIVRSSILYRILLDAEGARSPDNSTAGRHRVQTRMPSRTATVLPSNGQTVTGTQNYDTCLGGGGTANATSAN